MLDDPSLLVVDDEETICEGCRRIFSRQGFKVEKSSDAREGLSLASRKEYTAILLDMKMPSMDGIQFLEELRQKKPDVPVVMITGYPSIPTAASAIRLGVSDYVTKPFTPEEITQAVHRLLARRAAANVASRSASEVWTPADGQRHFYGESWAQSGTDGTVRVGAVVSRPADAAVESIRVPRVGETVYQGLPMAALNYAGEGPRVIPSPVSGVVVAVNPLLRSELSALWDDPCGHGWIAAVDPASLADDARACKVRRVVLANADSVTARDQEAQLRALGCQVRTVARAEEVEAAVREATAGVLVIDEASFGSAGPGLAADVAAAASRVKVVVLAASGSRYESAYRQRKIFYYALTPFLDHEIVDILSAAFRPPLPAIPAPDRRTTALDSISQIFITNRKGTKVCLLVAGAVMRKDVGLGLHLRHKLLERLLPVETTLGKPGTTQIGVLQAAETCDHLVVLLAKDVGRPAGSLIRDAKGEFFSLAGELAGKATVLVVQPDASGGGLATLDVWTTAALAEHVAREMAAC